jgi:trimeric autotransporter adhesin
MKILPGRSTWLLTLVALPLALGARRQAQTFTATLSPSSEVPAVDSKASGKATVTIDGNQLSFKVEVSNIDNATMAHIHAGAAGANGGVLVPLYKGDGSAGYSGTLAEGKATVEANVIEAIKSGNAYVNVHTKANPKGELRGQLVPSM